MAAFEKDDDSTRISSFRGEILAWYASNRRSFPWRETRDPWPILVSEVMLQQTQTERVVPKYLAFLEAFPDPAALARASVAELLLLWSGLGYNRRALALKRSAEEIGASYGGL
ncbi:MAG: A/G-specific adenine glycosylase, partial [Spirochaetota bacterium]